jgi:hypothetical protein
MACLGIVVGSGESPAMEVRGGRGDSSGSSSGGILSLYAFTDLS